MKYFICLLSMIVVSSFLRAQDIVNHEIRDEEEVVRIEGNGFNEIRDFLEKNSTVPFKEQSELLIRHMGGIEITLVGTILETSNYNQSTIRYVNGYEISDEIIFQVNENFDQRGVNNVVYDLATSQPFQRNGPVVLFGHSRLMNTISLRNTDVGDPGSLLLIEDFESLECLGELDQRELEDLLYSGLIINEERQMNDVRTGTVRLETTVPENFDCVVKVSGNLEFDGKKFFLANWKLINY